MQAELLERRDGIEDHVKNLYEKLGVLSTGARRSRLPRRVPPEVVLQAPLASRRRFDRE